MKQPQKNDMNISETTVWHVVFSSDFTIQQHSWNCNITHTNLKKKSIYTRTNTTNHRHNRIAADCSKHVDKKPWTSSKLLTTEAS